MPVAIEGETPLAPEVTEEIAKANRESLDLVQKTGEVDISHIQWQFQDNVWDSVQAAFDETPVMSHAVEAVEASGELESEGDESEDVLGEAEIEAEMASDEMPGEDSLEVAAAEGTEASGETLTAESGETIAAEPSDDKDLPYEFVDQERLYSIIESLLFAHDKPVSVSVMRDLFRGTNVKSKDIRAALEVLASKFAAVERGVQLEEIAGGYQLRTKPDNAKFLSRMSKERPFKLTGPSLEVLSIVAYKQPIVKSEIDQIRGVESGHLVRALMDRGLLNFQGKSELPGKPMLYGTTRKFLEIFGLRNLKELPNLVEIDELIPEGIGDPEDEKETLSDLTDRMSKEIVSTYSEGEEELGQITNQLSEIHTSSEFFENEKKREKEKRDRERAEDIRERMMVGEAVEDKDQAWLRRYDAAMAAAAAVVVVEAAQETLSESIVAADAAESKEPGAIDATSLGFLDDEPTGEEFSELDLTELADAAAEEELLADEVTDLDLPDGSEDPDAPAEF